MIKYTFKEGPLTIKNAKKADPQVIGEALSGIPSQDGLKPRAVLAMAKSNRHPLHKHFEWDNEIAGEAYRLEQARELIRIIRVEDDEASAGYSPAFYSITQKSGTAYHTHAAVKSSADLQLLVLRQAERDLDAFDNRYRELQDICAIVREAREKVREKRGKMETRDAVQ